MFALISPPYASIHGTNHGFQSPPRIGIAVSWRLIRNRHPDPASDISFLDLVRVMILGPDPSSSAHREGNIMRWKEGRRSENVEDRRGITPAGNRHRRRNWNPDSGAGRDFSGC